MKTITHNLALILFILPCLVFAGNDIKGGKYTKEKKIAKAYIVNSDAKLDVNNAYGSIYVTTWDEDKTQIEVVIKVSGNNEEKVDKRLASISIDLDATKALVRAQTNIGNMSGGNLSMEINYTIKIPKKGSIDLANQYGNIITGKIYGRGVIDSQYGDVNIDEFNADGNTINLQYTGAAKINYFKSGDIHAQYSGLNLTRAGNLKLKGEYTDMVLGDVNDLTYKTEYGDLNVKNAGNATGSGDYSDIRFGYISKLLNATCNYGDIKVGGMGKDVKNFAINATYSDIMVSYNENVPFDFEFKLEYGDFNGGAGFKFTERSDRDNSAHYKGYNKSSGVNRMYIKSEYGDINLSRG